MEEKKKDRIRRQIDEAENEYRKADQFNSLLQEYVNQSASRVENAIKNRPLSQARMNELMQLSSNAQNALLSLEEKREERQYEYKRQMEQYEEDYRLAEKEETEGNKEKGENKNGFQ